MKQIIKITLLNLLLFNLLPANASTFIDTFNDSSPQVAIAGFPGASSTVATSSAIGGYRTITSSSPSIAGGSAKVQNGSFIHGAAGSTATSTITWDANGTGLGLDLTTTDTLGFTGSNCYECFVFDVLTIDQGNVNLTLNLFNIIGSVAATYTVSGVGTGLFEIGFNQFVGANLANINAIEFIVAGGLNSDAAFNFLV